MVAERTELSSLNAPPEGWSWSEEARARRRALLWMGGRGGGKPMFVGPRPDAEPADHLPTLTPGIDILPQRCPSCGSALLDEQEPAGGEPRGLLSCTGCGAELAWLRPRIAAVSQAPAGTERSAQPISHQDSGHLRVSHVAVSTFHRLDSCSAACGWRLGHDPEAHERYGWDAAVAELGEATERPTGMIRTGPLIVDFDTEGVMVDGRPIRLTALEWGLLAHCAGRLGKLCPFSSLVAEVWDRDTAELWSGPSRLSPYHAVTTLLSRLRAKLGPAAVLLERVPTRGLLLRADPPIGEAEP